MAKFCESCGHPLEDNAQFCDKCGRRSAGHCAKCGATMGPGELFCQKCGTKAGVPAPQPPQGAINAGAQQAPQATAPLRPQPPVMPPQPPRPVQQPSYATPPAPKKSKTGLIVGLCVGAAVLVLLVAGGIGVAKLLNDSKPVSSLQPNGTSAPSTIKLNPFPDELKAPEAVKVNCQYKSPSEIIPANYRSMPYIVSMSCWTDGGSTKVMVSVEIPGFTQKYEQLVDVTRAEMELTIHPPLMADAAKALNSSKDAELVVSVTDTETGKVILQDTKPIKLYSRYDMQWQDDSGTPYYENILAWVTPEAPEIDKMLRASADSLSTLTNGAVDSIVGYQKIGDWSEADITYAQVCSMMYTLAKTYNVKYIMAPFSSTNSNLQSVATPAKVINNKGGLCIETAVTMASAIQRTNMHAVIILLPGHAQCAVETWTNSGEYLLIETTALDAARTGSFGKVVTYMNKDQWTKYMAQDGVVAIDCALAEKLHITSID